LQIRAVVGCEGIDDKEGFCAGVENIQPLLQEYGVSRVSIPACPSANRRIQDAVICFESAFGGPSNRNVRPTKVFRQTPSSASTEWFRKRFLRYVVTHDKSLIEE